MTITVDGDTQKKVDHFKYLGSVITEDGRCEADMRTRLDMVKSCCNGQRIVQSGGVWSAVLPMFTPANRALTTT